MKHYRFIHENATHYVMHDLRDRKHFNIAKKTLTPDMHEKIKAIPLLGGNEIGDAESKKDMGFPKQSFDDGGDVKSESLADKAAKFFSPAKPDKPALPSEDARKTTQDSMRKAFGMSEGGQVGEVDEDLSEELKKRFKTPLPPPPHEETQEERFARIRQENHERAMGTRSSHSAGYADGGEIDHNEGKSYNNEKYDPNSTVYDTPASDPNKTTDQVVHPRKLEKFPMRIIHQGNHTLNIYMGGELDGPKSETGAPNIGSDEKVTREQMLKVNPDKGFDKGGQVTGSGTPMGTGFGDGDQKAAPPFGKSVQHFDVGGTAMGVRPDTNEPQVQQEMLRLGVNAGLPGVTNTENVTGADLSPFRQQAELKVAQDVNQSDKNQAEQAQSRLEEQRMAHDKALVDNEMRVKAGFAPLEVPEAPPSPEIPAQQVAQAPPQLSRPKSPAMQIPDTLGEYQRAVSQQERGIKGEAAAKGQLAEEETALYNEHQLREKAHQLAYESEAKDLDSQNDKLFQAAQSSKIDPNKFWNEKSTGSKIATALSMIFGGALAGRTGQPNMAAQYLEKQVQNDLEAQKNDQSSKMNLYKMGLEKYKDRQSAEAFHNLQAYTMLQSQIKQAAAKFGGPQAQALADQAVGELESKKALLKPQLIQQGATLKMMQELSGNTGAAPGNLIDNNRWTALRMTGLLKPEDESAATKEATKAAEGESLRKSLTDSFNKLNTPGAGHLTPGLRDAEMQSLAGVLARVSEGRFNLQESKQQIEAIMPQLKDVLNPGIRQERLRKLNQLIDATVQTPTLDRFGLRRYPKSIKTSPPVIK